ncbi:MAG: LysE family translocator [Gammaproteobacteria bacterium]
MIEIEALITFFVLSVILSLTPGPDILYVFNQSVAKGSKIGVLITLGLCSGLVVHTLAVAFGLAVIVIQTPLALVLIQYLGVMYLLYLAWGLWCESVAIGTNNNQSQLNAWGYYRRGVLMNLSNPKVLLFFLAFLPQFVSKNQTAVEIQLVFLGLLFILAALLVFISVSLLAQSISSWLSTSRIILVRLNQITAMIFIVLAINLLLTDL